MNSVGQIAYALCMVTSLVCFGFLLRGYLRSRVRLLAWSSLCFFLLAVQNAVLFLDLVVTGPNIDLSIYRVVPGLLGPLVLLIALIMEGD